MMDEIPEHTPSNEKIPQGRTVEMPSDEADETQDKPSLKWLIWTVTLFAAAMFAVGAIFGAVVW